MPRFYSGKSFFQLLLKPEDIDLRNNIRYLLPLFFIAGSLVLITFYKVQLVINTQMLVNWVAAVAVFTSGFLAFKLYHTDQRRRVAETKANASELRFNKLYNSGMIGLWLTGVDGDIVQANDAFLQMIGYTRQELDAGKISWKSLTAPEYEAANKQRLSLLHEAGWCPPHEKEYIRKDGQRVPVMVGSALLSNDPKSGIMAYALDISQAKNIKEEVLRIFMEAPACIVIRKGPDLKVSFVNNAALAQSKLGRQNIEGATTADYLEKAASNFNQDILKEVYKTGKSFRQKAYPVRYDRYGNGQPIDVWYDIVIEPTHDAQGNIDGVATYTFDVSDLVRANEDLSSSEARFRFISDAIPHKMWTSDAEGKATYYNQGWYDYTGIATSDELSEKMHEVIHPDDLENSTRLWNDAVKNGTDVEIEQRLRQHDGQYLWHLSRVCVHKDDSGKLKMWVGTSTNIHTQKMAQARIAASESHFRTLANSNTLLIWQTDEAGDPIFVNDTWRAYTGIASNKTEISQWIDNMHPDDREQATSDIKSANVNILAYQSKYRFKDARTGEYRWMLDTANPIFNPAFSGYIGAMTDIHERELAKQAADELVKKKDEFFSIASHELKTPITTIRASLQILEKMLTQQPDLTVMQPFIEKANKQAVRLTGIVTDLLNINRIQLGRLEISKSNFSFTESIQECISELRLQYPERELIIKNSTENLIAWADSVRIQQVILNLLVNAFKYSPKNMPVIVTIEENDYGLKCSITDAGIGIPADKQSQVFERFFRVHQNSQNYSGLGVGLYICAEIIRQHQGQIGVISQDGNGSTFWFTLPSFKSV
jgi:PAS domain S-box-containing protein